VICPLCGIRKAERRDKVLRSLGELYRLGLVPFPFPILCSHFTFHDVSIICLDITYEAALHLSTPPLTILKEMLIAADAFLFSKIRR
jgi:hypothetical protein